MKKDLAKPLTNVNEFSQILVTHQNNFGRVTYSFHLQHQLEIYHIVHKHVLLQNHPCLSWARCDHWCCLNDAIHRIPARTRRPFDQNQFCSLAILGKNQHCHLNVFEILSIPHLLWSCRILLEYCLDYHHWLSKYHLFLLRFWTNLHSFYLL